MATEEKKHTTLSGYELKRVYGKEDLGDFDIAEKLGEPGHYPFTRGIRENMYRDSLWTMGGPDAFDITLHSGDVYRCKFDQVLTIRKLGEMLRNRFGIQLQSLF